MSSNSNLSGTSPTDVYLSGLKKREKMRKKDESPPFPLLPCAFIGLVVLIAGAGLVEHFLTLAPKEIELPLTECEYAKDTREYLINCGDQWFSQHYYEAKKRFRAMVATAQLPHEIIPIKYDIDSFVNRKRIVTNDLSIDLALIAGDDPSRLIIHVSGTHGVEAFGGSAIQLNILAQYMNNTLRMGDSSVRPNILLVHSINPFGFANLRRSNGDNVDIARNTLLSKRDWDEVLNRDSDMTHYETISSLINPIKQPFTISDYIDIAFTTLKLQILGPTNAVRIALGTGQYHNRKGIFYGGTQLAYETERLIAFLEHNSMPIVSAKKQRYTPIYDPHRLEQILLIDVHSGLGPFGIDNIFADNTADYDYLSKHLSNYASDGRINNLQTSNAGGMYQYSRGSPGVLCKFFSHLNEKIDFSLIKINTIARKNGLIDSGAYANTQFESSCVYMAEEFGTLSDFYVMKAMRDENAWFWYGKHWGYNIYKKVKYDITAAFAPKDIQWQRSVVKRGVMLLESALRFEEDSRKQ